MKVNLRSVLQHLLFQIILASVIAFARPVVAASWATNGPMTTARDNHTATLLSSGKVLIAGGWDGTNYVASAELFDPATGICSPTGSMTTNRSYHTATMLTNGKVLVVGGYCDTPHHELFSAELYDPATGTWTGTGPTLVAHAYHTATLLSNGKVLVAGGTGSTAELYDPSSGTWTDTGAMNRARWYHTATLLTNGNVLVAGGDYNYLPAGVFPTAEVYNPLTGTWTSTTAMTTNRTSPSATLLPDGRVLLAGGWLMAQVQTNPPAYSSFSLTSAELYDPATGNWTATTNTMTEGRNDHTASLLPNGQVLLAGGFQNGPGDRDTLELFDPVTSAWITITNKLNSARSHHTATLLPGGKVFVAGGFSRNWVTNSTEVCDSANGTWANASALSFPRANHTATLLPNGKVIVAGGDSNPTALSSAELFDPTTGLWTVTSPMVTPRSSHTATLLPNGKLLVAGGRGIGEILSAELYDPAGGSWMPTGAMNTKRMYHSATLLKNGKVLVAGGYNSANGVLSTAELYNPATGTWADTTPMNTNHASHTATLLLDGRVLIAGGDFRAALPSASSSAELYDPTTGKWMLTGSLTMSHGVGHTATLLPGGKVLLAGGVSIENFVPITELYDPAIGTWMKTGAMTIARGGHAAILLSNGKVLVMAGSPSVSSNTTNSAELYDSATGKWQLTVPLTTSRRDHTATLLANGKLLIAAGVNNSGSHHGVTTVLTNAELYDAGIGLNASSRPNIDTAISQLNLGDSLVITGSQFRGVSGASGGNTQDSSSDYPLVQLRSIESGQTKFLLTTNWSTNSFTSLPVWNFPPGWAMATVFVNGIPSTSSIVNITVPVPTPPTITDARLLTNGTFQFAFSNSVGAVFGALASTNLTLPLSNWSALGGVTENSPGQFQFTDPQATNSPQWFYRVRAN